MTHIGTASYSPDDNKIRIYPYARLDQETYARVKAAGFRWAGAQKLFVAPMWTPDREDLATELCGEIGDEDTSLVARAEERAERFDGYSESRMADANRARVAVAAIADNIPFGQPILVGHHSEKHARRDAEKIRSGMDKAVKMWKTSKYWTDRAAGALQHAKYKELPTVRARRIKTIEADKRRLERTIAESAAKLKMWSVEGLTLERARKIANVANPGVRRQEGNCFGYWNAYDVLQPDGERYSACPSMTVEEVQAAAKRAYTAGEDVRQRWIEHYDNRLTYERALLEEAGATALLAPKPRRELAPLLNYRAPGGTITAPNMYRRGEFITYQQVDMTKAEYARINIDYKGARLSTDKTHRFRTAMVKHSLVAVYLTDSKDHGAPATQTPAEFVAENVAPPATDDALSAALALAAEIIADDTAEPSHLAANILADLGEIAAPQAGAEALDLITDAADIDAALDAARHVQAAPAEACPEPSLAEKYAGPRVVVTCPSCGGFDVPASWLPHACDECGSPCTPAAADSPPPSPAADFEAMERMLRNGGGVQVVVAPQLFPTPAEIAAEMVEIAGIENGNAVLEPSAGTGAIIDAVRVAMAAGKAGRCVVTAVEINPRLADRLRDVLSLGGQFVRCGDFLECTGGDIGMFDRIIMNSPFENASDIKHIEHAMGFLNPGGRLVAICADGPRQRARLEPIASEYRQLPPGSFKAAGTMVNTALVVIDAPPA